ncbi:hypothetical protein APTSU1_001107900 [Apodemus speciosus]|uniref:Uncharacterized protein n=1 Tax=Apodemus speciosus TaxID=105296 RepID=A0ABQ0F994_APOSI
MLKKEQYMCEQAVAAERVFTVDGSSADNPIPTDRLRNHTDTRNRNWL